MYMTQGEPKPSNENTYWGFAQCS